VRLSHTLARTSAVFDDPDVVSHGGLVLVVALAAHADTAEELAKPPDPGDGRTWTPPDRSGRSRHRLRIQVRTVTAIDLLRRLSRRSELQMSARHEGRGIIPDIQGLRGLEGVPSLWCGWSCCPRRAPGKARTAGG
jgi:hypothetical protein